MFLLVLSRFISLSVSASHFLKAFKPHRRKNPVSPWSCELSRRLLRTLILDEGSARLQKLKDFLYDQQLPFSVHASFQRVKLQLHACLSNSNIFKRNV